MMDLYGMSSPNVLKISIMLAELGLAHRFHFVNLAAGEQFEPKFQALNPNGKVPVLVDQEGPGGRPYTVFESGAILIYLAEKTGAFWAAEPIKRYDVLQWLMIQVANVGPMLGQLTHFVRFAPAGNEYSASRYRTAAGRLYDMLDRRLAGSAHLAGDDYSIADIATFRWIWLYHQKHGMSWAEHPNLRRWCDQISARPAVAHALTEYEHRLGVDPGLQPIQSEDGLDRFFGRGRHARQ